LLDEEFASLRFLAFSKFFRQDSAIFNVNESVPFLEMIPEPPFRSHSDFLQDAA
jgi:hypothetical protein